MKFRIPWRFILFSIVFLTFLFGGSYAAEECSVYCPTLNPDSCVIGGVVGECGVAGGCSSPLDKCFEGTTSSGFPYRYCDRDLEDPCIPVGCVSQPQRCPADSSGKECCGVCCGRACCDSGECCDGVCCPEGLVCRELALNVKKCGSCVKCQPDNVCIGEICPSTGGTCQQTGSVATCSGAEPPELPEEFLNYPRNLVYNGPLIESLDDLIVPVAKILYYGGLAIGLFFIILSGYNLMTSGGDPQRTKNAQEQLSAAVIGILFILLSSTIINIIINDVIQL